MCLLESTELLPPKEKNKGGGWNRSHMMTNTSTYHIWMSMKARCERPWRKDYPRYGGAGITVCEEWRTFAGFLADMGVRPDGMSLDRIDNTKGYCKENCRWADAKTQARNQSTTRFITHEGQTKCMTEWAESLGMPIATFAARLSRGWSEADAITKPVDKRYGHDKNVGSRRTLQRPVTLTRNQVEGMDDMLTYAESNHE